MRFGNFHMRSVVVSFHLMSTPALAFTVPRVPRRLRRRRHALNRFPVQWHGAAVADTVALTGGKSPKRYLVLVLAAVAVLGAHITKGAEMYAELEGAQGRGKGRRKARK